MPPICYSSILKSMNSTALGNSISDGKGQEPLCGLALASTVRWRKTGGSKSMWLCYKKEKCHDIIIDHPKSAVCVYCKYVLNLLKQFTSDLHYCFLDGKNLDSLPTDLRLIGCTNEFHSTLALQTHTALENAPIERSASSLRTMDQNTD